VIEFEDSLKTLTIETEKDTEGRSARKGRVGEKKRNHLDVISGKGKRSANRSLRKLVRGEQRKSQVF